jgi:hypothetical protein
MKKCILIDAYAETITEVTIGEELQDIYSAIRCNTFECIDIGRFDTIYVDEEGLLKLNSQTKFFSIIGGYQPIAGNGLVMGYIDETGESCDTTLSVNDVASLVQFHTLEDVRKAVRQNKL